MTKTTATTDTPTPAEAESPPPVRRRPRRWWPAAAAATALGALTVFWVWPGSEVLPDYRISMAGGMGAVATATPGYPSPAVELGAGQQFQILAEPAEPTDIIIEAALFARCGDHAELLEADVSIAPTGAARFRADASMLPPTCDHLAELVVVIAHRDRIPSPGEVATVNDLADTTRGDALWRAIAQPVSW